MPIGIGLAVVGGVATAGISAIATSNAANDEKKAAQTASNEAAAANANTLANTQAVTAQTATNLNPTIQQGQTAGSALAGLENLPGSNPAASSTAFNDYLGSTNYQFQLGQGENAIEYANAPAFNSSATAKALNNYAQGQAGSALQGYEGLLTGQQTLGENAAAALGGVGVGGAQIINSSNQGAASQEGTAALAGGAANANALAGLAQIVNQQATQSSFGNGGNALANLFNQATAVSPFSAGG